MTPLISVGLQLRLRTVLTRCGRVVVLGRLVGTRVLLKLEFSVMLLLFRTVSRRLRRCSTALKFRIGRCPLLGCRKLSVKPSLINLFDLVTRCSRWLARPCESGVTVRV